MNVAVQFEAVSFGYHTGTTVLNQFHLETPCKSFVVLMGGSGTGKSTVLKLAGGLLKPSKGQVVTFFERAAMVHQSNGLLPWYNVLDNVGLPHRLAQGQRNGDWRSQARSILRKVGGGIPEDARPHELSGGMRKRVEVARLLNSDADLWLLDEPLESLDVASRLNLGEIIVREAKSRHVTVMAVTHNIDEAIEQSTLIVVIGSKGRVLGVYENNSPYPRDLDKPFARRLKRKVLSHFERSRG